MGIAVRTGSGVGFSVGGAVSVSRPGTSDSSGRSGSHSGSSGSGVGSGSFGVGRTNTGIMPAASSAADTFRPASRRSHPGPMLSGSGSIRIRSALGRVIVSPPAEIIPASVPFWYTRNFPSSLTCVSVPSSSVRMPASHTPKDTGSAQAEGMAAQIRAAHRIREIQRSAVFMTDNASGMSVSFLLYKLHRIHHAQR